MFLKLHLKVTQKLLNSSGTSLIQSKICHKFHYHVNIISKLMTESATELVEIVHFLSIITEFSVEAIRS